jgi:hypothetical protein
MMGPPADVLFPVDELSGALEQLAQRAGYGHAAGEVAAPAPDVEPSRVWMFALGDRLGVELEPITPLYSELAGVVGRAAPCVIQIRRHGRPHYLVLLGKRWGKLRLLARDGTVVSVETRRALELMREEQQATVAAEIDSLLDGVETSGRTRDRVRSRMLFQRLGQRQLRTGWIMRPKRTARRKTLLGDVPALMAGILVSHTLLSLVLAGSFWILGRAALQAHLETGWFEGWIAVIACAIPLRMLEVWWQGVFSIRVGTLLKQQLLAGILKLTPDEVRLDGSSRRSSSCSVQAAGSRQVCSLRGSVSRSSSRAGTTSCSASGRPRASTSRTTCSSACSAIARGSRSSRSSAGTMEKTAASAATPRPRRSWTSGPCS